MCTASWNTTKDGYELWFNRDESIHRPPAQFPSIHHLEKESWICPIDPLGEGTWIFGNHHGLSACLLNDYQASTEGLAAPDESRGRLLYFLAAARNPSAFEKFLLRELEASVFAPFSVVCISRTGEVYCWNWDGHNLRALGEQNRVAMITSSSWNFDEVSHIRHTCFDQLIPAEPSSRDHAAFHLSQAQAGPEYSVMMTRPESRTVSLSRIQLRQGRLSFTYEPRNPDGSLAAPELTELEIQ